MKSKQELIDKWESAIEAAEFYGKGKEESLISYMRDFVDDLNQLDEPEVLSQEWIDDHKHYYPVTAFNNSAKEIVDVEDLQSLLVPKRDEREQLEIAYKDILSRREFLFDDKRYVVVEKPTVPQFVADWIEESHLFGSSLNHDIFNLITDAYDTDADERKLIENYLYDSSDAIETIVDAYRYGYEVEEEQKYYVINKQGTFALRKGTGGVANSIYTKKEVESLGELQYYQLTEQEIKDYDERYWPFAVKVEELEE